MKPSISNLAARARAAWRWKVQGPLLRAIARPEARDVDDHGTWAIPSGWLNAESRCIAAGVGEEIRFEQSVVDSYGSRMLLLDPTPRAVTFINGLGLDPVQFTFRAVGLWGENTTLRFYAPRNEANVSHSITDAESDQYFEAPCETVASIASTSGIEVPDLLKMNIEGAEYVVLESLMRDGLFPRIIALTFEGRGAFRKGLRWILRLRSAGYRVVGAKGWAYTFARFEAGQ